MGKAKKLTGRDYKLALRAANRVYLEIREGLRAGEGVGPIYSANVAYKHRWIGICFTKDELFAPHGMRTAVVTYPLAEWLSVAPPDFKRVTRDLTEAMGRAKEIAHP